MREERADGVLTLTFDRPERLNAVTGEVYQQMRHALERAALDDGVRVVVLTGEGRAFSAGADRSLIDGTGTDEARALAAEEFPLVLQALGGCDRPVIAAVNGLAVGIGATILLHCDLVLAAASARLRFPFTALGLLPEAASSVLLPARASWNEAMWAMLSSEWIDAAAAQAMGLVWRVVPDEQLAEETSAVAAQLAALDPLAVRTTKRLMVTGRAAVVDAAMQRELAAYSEIAQQRRR